MLKIILLANPSAGRGRVARELPKIEAELHARSVVFETWRSQRTDDLATLAADAREATQRLVVVGGDGTLQNVVQGLMPEPNVELALLPCGTGNDFAKMLKLGQHWQSAIDLCLGDQTRLVDVGLVESERGKHYFLNGLGIGFDADVVASSMPLRRWPKAWIYPVALLKQWLRGVSSRSVVVRSGRRELSTNVTLCAVANGQYYGGRFRLNPTARIDDGLFDVLVAQHLSRWGILKLLPDLFRGTHLLASSIEHWQCAAVSIESDRSLPIQLDGELIEPAKKFEVSMRPQALRMAC